MSREIKFRFWDKDLKKMCERKPAHNDFSHPNIVPLQFTGVKDRNGKEIYEGDLVNIIGSEKKYLTEVLFDSGKFFMQTIRKERLKGVCYDFWELFKEDIELLGNIYEGMTISEHE